MALKPCLHACTQKRVLIRPVASNACAQMHLCVRHTKPDAHIRRNNFCLAQFPTASFGKVERRAPKHSPFSAKDCSYHVSKVPYHDPRLHLRLHLYPRSNSGVTSFSLFNFFICYRDTTTPSCETLSLSRACHHPDYISGQAWHWACGHLGRI